MNVYRCSPIRKKTLAAAVAILILVACSEMETKWTREIDLLGPGDYMINSTSSTKDAIYLSGTYRENEQITKAFVVKYDTEGSLDWYNIYEAPGIVRATGRCIIASRTGAEPPALSTDVHALVQARDTTDAYMVILVRYDTLGNIEWQNTVIAGEGKLNATLLSDHVGNLYVAGWENDKDDKSIVFIGKYTEDGGVRWFTKYHNEQIDFDELKFDMMHSDCLLIAGLLTYSDELFYMKYNGSGQLMGFIRHKTKKINAISDIKIDPHGNVYIAASVSTPNTGNDYFTVVYNKDDELVWTSQYDGTGHQDDTPQAIAVDESLNVYVAGTSENRQGIPTITVVKYDTLGSLIWAASVPQKKPARPLLIHPQYLRLGRQDEPRHLYVAGTAGENAVIARCNLQGIFSWVKEYSNHGKDTKPTAMSAKYLALQSTEDGGSDARIIKFGPSAILGIARWD